MSELLSVIIPVYQNKRFLKECVYSVLNQKYRNIEIILVDDGSTDGSAELCDELSANHKCIFVKHIQNVGPYQARKEGVKISHGNVITFVDSDDWVEENAYEELMKIYEQFSPSIISYAFKVDSDGFISENYFREGLYEHDEIIRHIIPSMMYESEIGGRMLNPSVCCKLFEKNIYEKAIEGICENINWGEDALVTYPAISIAKSVYIIHTPYYNYRLNNMSETHNYPSKRFDELVTFFECMKRFFKTHGLENEMAYQLECYMRIFLEMLVVNRWGIHRTGCFFVFPYSEVTRGTKLQIYGAGDVGKSYICELLHSRYAEVVGWYDMNYEQLNSYAGIAIRNPEEIVDTESEAVLIAVQDEKVAEKIKKYINTLGVELRKIIWKRPIRRS